MEVEPGDNSGEEGHSGVGLVWAACSGTELGQLCRGSRIRKADKPAWQAEAP